MFEEEEIVGLIPAGGQATRLSPLPCSKELFPIGYHAFGDGKVKPKVVSHFLLEKYKIAGIKKVYFILRKGKWDIPQYYGDGAMVDMDLAYLMMNLPHGHPFTLDQAYPFTRRSLVAFGYPDILFEPEDAFAHLIQKQAETKASIVLGVFPIRPDQKWDIAGFGADGKIQTIALKEPIAEEIDRLGWSIALWTPEFSTFMHEFLLDAVHKNQVIAPDGREYTLDHLLQAALDSGMSIECVTFDSGFVLDVGTPKDLFSAQRAQLESARELMAEN